MSNKQLVRWVCGSEERISYRKGLEAMDKVKDRQDETAKEEHAEEDQ